MGYNLSGKTAYVLYSARGLAETIGLPLITKEVFFSTLFIMPQTPLHMYFLSKGVKEDEIEEKQTMLFNEMAYGQHEYFSVPITFSVGDDREPEGFILDSDIIRILDLAKKIAKEQYDSESVDISHVTAAFAELYNKEFMHIVKTFIPSAGNKNSLNEPGYMMSDDMFTFEVPRELCSFLTPLNDKFADMEECHICGRDEETKALIRVLMKRTKRNAVLVGEAGVGKTALVEKFTWMIENGDCPEQLKGSIVLSLDVNAIVAGTMYRGTAEDRFRKLIEFLEANPFCILFVDEIHLLLGAGACREGDLDLANALKPLLARGETRVIGATTEYEYTRYFSKDSALKRRFEKIVVSEPRSFEIYDMIKNQIKLLEDTHKTRISRELVDAVIFKASCFNFETKNPDRTLDLLDKTMVCAELAGREEVIMEDILENFNVNQKKFSKMSEENKSATAYHEAGHYIAHRFSDELIDQVMLAVSIIPAEDYLGVNVFEIDPDVTPSNNRRYYIQKIGALLAGRIAEKMYSKTLTAGASSDLTKATKIARDMVTLYGLDEEFSEERVILRDESLSMCNEKMITDINTHIDAVLKEAREYVEKLLSEKRKYLDVLAKALIEKGMLSSSEIDELFQNI